jgi:DNA-binding transcriptional LysR family regulator
MNLKHMHHLIAVAEELHFGRAARRPDLAQSPLSQFIRRLKADLGIELFVGAQRSVELTAAGRVLLKEAKPAVLKVEFARRLTIAAKGTHK